eukprot:CAMPEP_0169254874 /NCGR_PEP_ID=MMETSP1016-20121227/39411_1 /TAXON_ID=342587 /ORGANISM="Karlodinium micrum, Strain CCMP2283" /LENGTH=90 /DNA_ID=CAMNT_0009336371 /DNA_START=564 /DNA_END=833 /DNA_ORIENTATION=-
MPFSSTFSTFFSSRWANADWKSINEDLACLQGSIGRIRGCLGCKAHVHKIFARNARIRRLVAMHNLAKLGHRSGHSHAAVIRHDASGNSN